MLDLSLNNQFGWGAIPTNSVGYIRAFDFVEHMKDPIQFMNQVYRVLAPGGWLRIAVPSTDGRGAFQDPTHVSFWNLNSFWYYANEQYAKYIQPDFFGRFQISQLVQDFPTEWHKENNIPYVHADLIALKDNKAIGESLWPR
jgi:predicted SAM-dependent methyltransferase